MNPFSSVRKIRIGMVAGFLAAAAWSAAAAYADDSDLFPEPAADFSTVPTPGPSTAAPYVPRPILPGGIVIPLYPPGSPRLRQDRIREAERYRMSTEVPGRIISIVNIHNPSIEMHPVEASLNTGAVVILLAGGAHNTLNVGGEGADFVPWFYNFGVATVILRNRLKSDGYNPLTDEVFDAFQAIRVVRAHAAAWKIDPAKIGLLGFSAGAELAAATAVSYESTVRASQEHSGPVARVSDRPDFVGLIYPGPTPFTRDPATKVPADAPPTFIACAGSGDRQHALWADTYFAGMLKAGIPNLEMHIYGNGVHANGLQDRGGTPFGTWQDRFIDWFRDLGFLGKPGVTTKAAKDAITSLEAAQVRLYLDPGSKVGTKRSDK